MSSANLESTYRQAVDEAITCSDNSVHQTMYINGRITQDEAVLSPGSSRDKGVAPGVCQNILQVSHAVAAVIALKFKDDRNSAKDLFGLAGLDSVCTCRSEKV